MEKGVVISERDARRIEIMLRWFERRKNQPDQPRRRSINISGSDIRKAYCKTDAGAGSTIVCHLNTDGTGEEITVHCNISGGSNLNSAIRALEDGNMLAVWNDNGTWRAIEGFQARRDDCICVEE